MHALRCSWALTTPHSIHSKHRPWKCTAAPRNRELPWASPKYPFPSADDRPVSHLSATLPHRFRLRNVPADLRQTNYVAREPVDDDSALEKWMNDETNTHNTRETLHSFIADFTALNTHRRRQNTQFLSISTAGNGWWTYQAVYLQFYWNNFEKLRKDASAHRHWSPFWSLLQTGIESAPHFDIMKTKCGEFDRRAIQ